MNAVKTFVETNIPEKILKSLTKIEKNGMNAAQSNYYI
jgi:hypothetical protein